MKKLVYAFAGAFALMAVALIVLMIYAINRGIDGDSITTTDLKLVNTQKVKLDNIISIDISFYSDDIEFFTSDSDELILKEYKTYEPKPKELAKVTTSSDKLTIKGKKFNFKHISFKNHYSKAEIYLPAKYAEDLRVSTSSGDISSDLSLKMKQFEMSCSSGDINLNEVYADNIVATTSSGDITMQRAEGNRQLSASSGDIKISGGYGKTYVETSSGDINVYDSNGNVNVNCTSGDVTINNTVGQKEISSSSGDIVIANSKGDIQADSTSGEIKITALEGSGKLETSSGEIQFDVSKITGPISMNASSGSIRLNVSSGDGFALTADTSSGSLRTNFDDLLTLDKERKHANGTVGESTGNEIQIGTSSGDIRVNRN